MTDVKWIKISTDMFNNRKIKQVRKLPEGDALISIWVQILCLAGQINDNGMVYFSKDIPYTEEMLSTEFDRPVNLIRIALHTFEKFKMVEIVDNILLVSNWEKYQSAGKLDTIREQNRLRQEKYRENQKLLAKSNVSITLPVTQGNAIELELELDKDKEYIYGDFFETLWKLYPKKKGKGQVSKSQKQKLYKIGTEEMTRCIERYKKDASGTDEKFLQYGSTFFNSGYVDYLDKNYTETKKEQQGKYKDMSNYNPV